MYQLWVNYCVVVAAVFSCYNAAFSAHRGACSAVLHVARKKKKQSHKLPSESWPVFWVALTESWIARET